MFFTEQYSSINKSSLALIRFFNLNITKSSLLNSLNVHPHHPSLLSLSDVLNQYGVDNYSFQDVTFNNLYKINQPFIAFTDKKGMEFLFIEKIDEENIYSNGKPMLINNFKMIFKGVILIPDPNEKSGDPNFFTTKKAEASNLIKTLGFYVCSILVFLGLILINTVGKINVEYVTFIIIIKFLGLITSVLLLIQSINTNNPYLQKLCQSSTNINCTQILSSNAAKVFDGLSWAEVGFFYFSGTILTVVFYSGSHQIINIIALANFVSLPYTVYSIYYQARIAKTWCTLCCITQLLLWVESIPLMVIYKFNFTNLDIKTLCGATICLALPAILWFWIRPQILAAQKNKKIIQKLDEFKYNPTFFETLLKNKLTYSIPEEEWSIVLGSNQPDKVITMVSNPFCNPCSLAHKSIEELLQFNKNIQVRFVFVFNRNNTDNDIRMVVARHLLSLYQFKDKSYVEKAMNDWYQQKNRNFINWSKKYPTNYDENTIIKLVKHREWCDLNNINVTPTILINQYKLPTQYDLSDLKYL